MSSNIGFALSTYDPDDPSNSSTLVDATLVIPDTGAINGSLGVTIDPTIPPEIRSVIAMVCKGIVTALETSKEPSDEGTPLGTIHKNHKENSRE
ncbi:hypothetical protein [Bifidobacterium tissieri]|uniref:Uncharacterized protein n=1 Tax=Bifidobacterium tissieri TaxID=1630162 RepID=A0A5M9ZVU1_9BIFI|nr:hypothetical protein [Bifidobacterium tissieri]KAA8828646.1 hypothetical protein EM849_11455 [Bifidobacterium tissieri]KAA8831589.1 hypothetical protein EMO89_02370 [Bifidobacterium tissieri]